MVALTLTDCGSRNSQEGPFTLSFQARPKSRYFIDYSEIGADFERRTAVTIHVSSDESRDSAVTVKVANASEDIDGEPHAMIHDGLVVDLKRAGDALEVNRVEPNIKMDHHHHIEASVPKVLKELVTRAMQCPYLSLLPAESLLTPDSPVKLKDSWEIEPSKAGAYLDLVYQHPTGSYAWVDPYANMPGFLPKGFEAKATLDQVAKDRAVVVFFIRGDRLTQVDGKVKTAKVIMTGKFAIRLDSRSLGEASTHATMTSNAQTFEYQHTLKIID